jgi:proteasome accessory factor A
MDAGLVEGGTPECRGPSELLLYQKAQERLLVEALEGARSPLQMAGVDEASLIKNCRDAFGNVYGAQENYEVTLARGAWLWLYRLGLLLLAPWSLAFTLLGWAFVGLFVAVSVPLFIGLLLIAVLGAFSTRISRLVDSLSDESRMTSAVMAVLRPLNAFWVLAGTPYVMLLRLTCLREIRHGLIPFMVARPIICGAGSLEDDDHLVLSEKAGAVRRVQRIYGTVAARVFIDTGNLLKSFVGTARWGGAYASLFARRQRLQLGLSDSNRAQVAEYLKVGMTCLIIDMIEDGELDDAPRLVSPVRALHTLNADPTLTAKVPLRDGSDVSALELSRSYLERAREWVAESKAPSLEAREVLRLWGQCLDALERDPGLLVGRVDWLTKRWLIEAAGVDSWEARKKIDLKYHELDTGYFERLEDEGIAPVLVGPAEIERAMHEPPAETPARMRGRLIRELAEDQKVKVDWGSVRVGGLVGGKLIRLDEFRRR